MSPFYEYTMQYPSFLRKLRGFFLFVCLCVFDKNDPHAKQSGNEEVIIEHSVYMHFCTALWTVFLYFYIVRVSIPSLTSVSYFFTYGIISLSTQDTRLRLRQQTNLHPKGWTSMNYDFLSFTTFSSNIKPLTILLSLSLIFSRERPLAAHGFIFISRHPPNGIL
jgi:hypothetical protein